MGITLQHALLLAKEAQHRPLPETVHLIGRQTVYLTEDGLLDLLRGLRFQPRCREFEIDRQTGGARVEGRDFVTDTSFFKALGAAQVRSIDISPYEGADIILDLNRPLPDRYEASADFIFGGSVCDNVFDPAMYLRNICRMLKPGGRYISQEIASNEYHPYVVLPPAWHFDYFVLNRFADAQILVFDICKTWNVYGLDVDPDYKFLMNYTAPMDHTLGVFIIAEKGADSTWERSPTQEQYRSDAEWEEYRSSLRRIRATARPFPQFPIPVTESQREFHPPQWLPYYRYLGRLEPAVLAKDLEALRSRVNALVEGWQGAPGTRVAVWGAGACAEFLMEWSHLDKAGVVLWVDSDPALQGRDRWGHWIHSPEALAGQDLDAVLVASTRCQAEIVDRLRALASQRPFRIETLLP